MKSIALIIAVLLTVPSLVIGQDLEDEVKTYRLELGFNASPLLQKIVSPQSLFNTTDETLLLFNVRLHDQLYLRSGYNATFSSVNFPEDSFNTSNLTSNLGTRLGLEWRNRISNLWELHYGFDLVYRYSKQEFISQSFDQNGNIVSFISDLKRNDGGAGPILGVTFWPHSRIGIFVEAGFYMTYFNQKESTIFDGEQNTFNDFNGWNGTSQLPTAIHLKIKL